jgi:hypothetical protein
MGRRKYYRRKKLWGEKNIIEEKIYRERKI